MPPNDHPLVFVYGTLKRGFHNHRVMEDAGGEFVCTGRTQNQYPLVAQGLPYLLNHPGTGKRVEGEIFQVSTSEGWDRLDHLEGHPGFYQREVIAIEGVDRDIYDAWTYFLVGDGRELAGLPHLCAYGRDSGLSSPELVGRYR